MGNMFSLYKGPESFLFIFFFFGICENMKFVTTNLIEEEFLIRYSKLSNVFTQ